MGTNSKPKRGSSGAQGSIKCAECGSDNITTSDEQYIFPYGVGSEAVKLTTRVPVRKCADCGFSYMDNAAEWACHETICEHLGVMKPSQVKGLRDYYGLTQSEFSNITGLGEATLSRWERGIVIQNQAYDNYLYLLGFNENLQRIQKRRESPDLMKSDLKGPELPKFRQLDVNDEVLQRKNSFKLRLFQFAGKS